jgi:hypothetical protein
MLLLVSTVTHVVMIINKKAEDCFVDKFMIFMARHVQREAVAA